MIQAEGQQVGVEESGCEYIKCTGALTTTGKFCFQTLFTWTGDEFPERQ